GDHQEAEDEPNEQVPHDPIVVGLDLWVRGQILSPEQRADHPRQHDRLDDQRLVEWSPLERIADPLQDSLVRSLHAGQERIKVDRERARRRAAYSTWTMGASGLMRKCTRS